MNPKVFERAMFQAKNKPSKAKSGITQGFEEEGLDKEVPDDEMADEVSRRSPRSPEILMNNLRGDMRSVDARYQELASMVGEDVADETPPEILAMLQSQFAQQAAPSGIGALPPGQGATLPPSQAPDMGGAPMPTPPQEGAGAPPGMPALPPGMPTPPPGVPAGMPAPQGMYQGGEVTSGAIYDRAPKDAGIGALQTAGRYGDTMVAHMTPQQHEMLSRMGGGSTINPKTGLPEHFLSAAANMGSNMLMRAAPYAQAANQLIGARMSPMLSKPTLEQGRSTLGTFLPKTAEGLAEIYPSLTQRVGMVTAPVVNAVKNSPFGVKAGAALALVPGAQYVNSMMSSPTAAGMPMNNNGSDVPLVAGTDDSGRQVFKQPPPPVATGPDGLTKGESVVPEVSSIVEQASNPPTAPRTVEELQARQAAGNDLTAGTKASRLDAYMQENLPIFEKYMGGDKEANQAQALFLLADAGIKLASEGGRTPAIALAKALRGVAPGLAQLGAQEQARKQQVSGAALTSGLQTIAAENKAQADSQKELIKRLANSGQVTREDLGAGATSWFSKTTGEPLKVTVDPLVTDSFLGSRFTPQQVKDKEGSIVGFDTPYAVVKPKGQTTVLDKETRVRVASEVSRQEFALAKIDDALKDYTGAFGPKSAINGLINNVFVPVTPMDPRLLSEEKKTRIMDSMNTAVKAIARSGDTGNIAVAEQKAAAGLLGDNPGTFFSDSDTALKRIMTIRTQLANQRLAAGAQLGWVNQDMQLSVPNLGTKTDPIPADKLSYVAKLAGDNPGARVYVLDKNNMVQQVDLSTLKQ